MISENFKKIFSGSDTLLRILMAVIFLSAGIFRIFNPDAAAAELDNLSLPHFLTWFIFAIEIGGGAILLIGRKIKLVILVFILFLMIALGSALFTNGPELIKGAGELFTFNANPTDFFMHFVFLVVLIFLLQNSKV